MHVRNNPTVIAGSSLLALLLLAACLPSNESALSSKSSDSSSSSSVSSASSRSSSSVRETANVTYEGIVKTAGISIYQEGTHRLVLDDGKFLLLRGEGVDLNGYIDERALVFGSVRPTVEEGGTFMSVTGIKLTGESASSDSSDSTDDEGDSSSSDFSLSSASTSSSLASKESSSQSSSKSSSSSSSVVTSSSSSQTSSSSSSSELSSKSSSASSLSSSSQSSKESSASSMALSSDLLEQIAAMSQDDLSSERWTQRYCSSHIGFCIPVHKNWWFMSFGSTSSNLWHVEIGAHELEAIGQGPVLIRLVSGGLDSKGATDKSVKAQGSQVIGFREWTENRHFEIIADAKLEAIISHLTNNLSVYEEQ